MYHAQETDERYEIWDGRFIVTEPASGEHEYITVNLAAIVHGHVRKHRLGRVYGSNFAIYLHGDVMRQDFRLADLIFVSEARLGMVQSKGIIGAPDLLVEILSPGKSNTYRDRVEKFQLYEQYGVSEYWIVHPLEEYIEIYVLCEGQYKRCDQSQVLPGIDLSEAFD